MVGPPIFDAVPENTGSQRCAAAAYRGLEPMDDELRLPECSWVPAGELTTSRAESLSSSCAVCGQISGKNQCGSGVKRTWLTSGSKSSPRDRSPEAAPGGDAAAEGVLGGDFGLVEVACAWSAMFSRQQESCATEVCVSCNGSRPSRLEARRDSSSSYVL